VLGQRRAYVVRRVLITLGVASSRIGTMSYGKEWPVVPGSSARTQNRRAVTVIQ
jgi:peptidoglycan-associated lipoprotein